MECSEVNHDGIKLYGFTQIQNCVDDKSCMAHLSADNRKRLAMGWVRITDGIHVLNVLVSQTYILLLDEHTPVWCCKCLNESGYHMDK
jgi:hypothetical protein